MTFDESKTTKSECNELYQNGTNENFNASIGIGKNLNETVFRINEMLKLNSGRFFNHH